MRKSSYVFALGLLVIILISVYLPGILFPSDLLTNLPSFSLNNWKKPKNSLLADPVFQFEPWRKYAKERIQQGEFPLWNDRNGSGSPFFANPQTAVLYPLNIFYYLLPVKISLNLIILLKLYLFAVFTYLFIRELKYKKLSAALGSLVAVFSGFPVVWVQWPHMNVFILFPLILLITEKIKNDKNHLYRWFTVLSLTYFVGVLGGHPETLFMIFVMHMLYILFCFKKKTRYIALFLLSIIVGLLLGAIQLLPFIEYLLNSYALNTRSLSDLSFLPKISFIQNLIPFILGAPHTQFYKPILNFTNFQETIGGYTGTAVLIFSAIGFFLAKLYKKGYIWLFMAVISLILSYEILPVQIINLIPVINKNANQRFIAFFSFAIAVIFSLLIDKIREGDVKPIKLNKKIIYYLVFACVLLFLSIHFIGRRILSDYPEKTQLFLGYFEIHFVIILISTALFFILILKALESKHRSIYVCLLCIPILAQNFLLLWDYNPLIGVDEYYPKTELVRKLQSLPKGQILEVGNMALTSDINLVYGLSSIENNDAIQIASYKKAFDKAFPIKNQWKNVDYASLNSLQDFGVKYVISDHNINVRRDKIQSHFDKIIPLTETKRINIPFIANQTVLSQIRILTANYNRLNTCSLHISVIDYSDNKTVGENNIDCRDLRDFMFYSVSFPQIQFEIGKKYNLVISSADTAGNNYIGLWGNNNNIPYIEILYDLNDNVYKLLWNNKSVYLWEVPDVREIVTQGEYSLLYWKPERKEFKIKVNKPDKIQVKITYYPGWSVFIDGKKENIIKLDPFMEVIIPEGKHTVEFKYQPLSFYIGILLTLLTSVSVLIYFTWKEVIVKRLTCLNNQ